MPNLSLVDAVIHHMNSNSLAHRTSQTKVELLNSERISGAATSVDNLEGQSTRGTGKKGEETG